MDWEGTGKEHKQMEKVFIGAIAGGIDKPAVQAARSLMDFIYYCQFPTLDEEDLEKMDELLLTFHNLKDIFLKLEVRENFNIPKLHALVHYTYEIRLHGTPDGYNTETPEHLHIDLAKAGYRASNKRNYMSQMTKYMQRREAIAIRGEYMEFMSPFTAIDEDVNDELDDSPSDLILDEGMELDEQDLDQEEDSNSSTSLDSESDSDEVAPKGPSLAVERQSVIAASKQPFGSVGVKMLSDAFGAPDFLERVTEYVSQQPNTSDFYRPTRNDKFPVFKKITIKLGNPLKPGDLIVDHVHATPAKATGMLKALRKHPVFDTVLVRQVSG
ncbi:hypothetical protein FRC01_010248 [Tulasnella sp. 417]|nr:hypothetical protein FRC01_010248 [Tulasnella sp. 417]